MGYKLFYYNDFVVEFSVEMKKYVFIQIKTKDTKNQLHLHELKIMLIDFNEC